MNIHKAIKKINADAEFTYKNDDVDTIEWLNGTTPISKADIKTEMDRLQAIEDNA